MESAEQLLESKHEGALFARLISKVEALRGFKRLIGSWVAWHHYKGHAQNYFRRSFRFSFSVSFIFIYFRRSFVRGHHIERPWSLVPFRSARSCGTIGKLAGEDCLSRDGRNASFKRTLCSISRRDLDKLELFGPSFVVQCGPMPTARQTRRSWHGRPCLYRERGADGRRKTQRALAPLSPGDARSACANTPPSIPGLTHTHAHACACTCTRLSAAQAWWTHSWANIPTWTRPTLTT